MADFDYIAIDTRGAEKRGHVAASDIDTARAALDARKLYVVRIDPGSAPATKGRPLFGLKLGTPKMSGKDLTLFTRQLATLNRVSPLEESLRTITRQTEQDSVREIVTQVHTGVVEGRRLADSMARAPKSFPPLYRAMVAAGESSGTLPTILDRLAALLERQAEIRGKLITALAYPTILAVVALGVVTALMMFVVPQVVEQFDNVGQQLPLLTRMVIALSDFLVGYWWAMLLVIAAAAFLGWRALKDEVLRLAFDSWLLRIPLLGRFAARSPRGADGADAGDDGGVAAAIARRPDADRGDDPQPAVEARLRRDRRQYPRRRQPLRRDAPRGRLSAAADVSRGIGEAAGRLDEMLERAADYLEREFDRFTATALSLLEPAIIVVMGGIVATIVLSILLPILQLNTLAGT